LLNIMGVEHFNTKLNFSPIRKASEKHELSAPTAFKYERSGWGHDSATPHVQADGDVVEEPVSTKVARMLADAGLTLDKPTQLENMVIAINRLEGAQQDETNRGLALLVREGMLTHREALLLGVSHSRQR
jgi:hypothetical protein